MSTERIELSEAEHESVSELTSSDDVFVDAAGLESYVHKY